MRGDNTTTPDWKGVAITATIMAITGYIGLTVFQKVTRQELVEASKTLETTCVGISGCGPSSIGLLKVIMIVVFLAVIIVSLFPLRAPTPDDGGDDDDDFDPVAQLQEQYVNGEIQTTVKLERELSDVLDPEVDDATLSEIDDLLGDDDA